MSLRALGKPAQPSGLPRFPEKELVAAGLDTSMMFGWGKVAFRRIEKVTDTHVEVDGGKLPKALLGQVTEGQWLRFTKAADGRVEVSVDLKATCTAEARLTDLFVTLSTPRKPVI